MIEFASGNLLEAQVDALVNTVNTVGVMGKGIALQFKQAYPDMFRAYERACRAGEVQLGSVSVYDVGGLVGGPRWIINFPTKAHWRAKSRIKDVEAGLHDLVRVIRQLGIRSVALPPLGCGNGGLDWADVRPLIESAFGAMPEVRVRLYAPGLVPAPASMINRTERPTMTLGKAALVGLMDRYLEGLLDPFVSLLEVHKLMYFLQAAGQPLNLKYRAGEYGPYATNLRQVLIRMEHHYTQGYGDGSDQPTKPIELLPGAIEQAKAFLATDRTTGERMDRVADLIEGYEDPLGLELLSSVHWVMATDPEARKNADAAVAAVHGWNARKRRVLKCEQIVRASERLQAKCWLPEAV